VPIAVLASSKDEGRAVLNNLVETFRAGRGSFTSIRYNETQLRNDFISPFLKALGWDVDNVAGHSQFFRDVIQEEGIDVDNEGSKRPDYTLRIQGFRKLFVEVKKPSLDIERSSSSAFQVRRYGWNANLGISILTNFDKLIIYDCRHKPDAQDDERVARIRVYDHTEYVNAFDELFELLSCESVSYGKLDESFSIYEKVGQTFDSYFLAQIESWREHLAKSAIQRNRHLNNDEINLLVQRLLNRIVFLRICEDRTIEKHETLKEITNYDQLKQVFIQSDKKYNSGLFNFIEDTLSLNIEIDSETLIQVFSELYYPLSPYNFAVVDSTILSQIYERFLGSHVFIDESRQYSIVAEPEVVASNGVVPTPKLIVEKIIKDTLSPLVVGKTSQELSQLKIADICCGSGTFLLSVYDFLLKSLIERLKQENVTDKQLVRHELDGTVVLTLTAKKKVLETNIFGVDINPYAVEVTVFSLLLKSLEGESGPSIDEFISQNIGKVLPDLSDNLKSGNSLVDSAFFQFKPEALTDDRLLFKVKPFEWKDEFPFLNHTKGFDAIVGNPPYVRIQNLVKYAPEEIKYYQSKFSGYAVAKKETIDKYYVFIQRAISLLRPEGCLGYIVPHKFFINKGGKTLREFIIQSCSFLRIVHFGVTQVFPDRSTYTAILVLQKTQKPEFDFKRIKKLHLNLLSDEEGYIKYNRSRLTDEPWVFVSPETEAVFNKVYLSKHRPLKSFAAICVGLQTSNDDIYIFTPEQEDQNFFYFNKGEATWLIEKDICHPCVLDLKFSLYDSISANTRIIFPYKIVDGKAELYSVDYLQSTFPKCWAYLTYNKAALQKRNLNGKEPVWYQFGRSQSLTKFHNCEKLIWKVLSTEPSYILDKQNLQFTGGGNGPYYSLINNSEYSILYLMGILAHPLFEMMVKAGASEFRGAYYSHGKQFIANLPIRIIDNNNINDVELYNTIVSTVENLIDSKEKFNSSNGVNRGAIGRKLRLLQDTLIEAVNKLYGISEEELNAVLNDEMFTTELTVE
jgi:type I restriction-modification system DNA methylase subunit